MVTQPHETAGPQQVNNIISRSLRGADPGPMGTRVIGGRVNDARVIGG
jgi:hypothetical protein